MKIEKINDNQIRCTLTKKDLIDREIKISELAYGTDKAKTLFRDMMQQAAYEFGFEANDIPLMIEAIPLSPESIILIITKVEDPEELDTRFSKFAPADAADESEYEPSLSSKLEGADDILGLFNKIREAKKKASEKKAAVSAEQTDVDTAFNLTRLYKFNDLDAVIRVAHILSNLYSGTNTLYKDETQNEYHLIISKSDHTPEEFNKICNILSEYGINSKYTSSMNAFYTEHKRCIIPEKAIQKLTLI